MCACVYMHTYFGLHLGLSGSTSTARSWQWQAMGQSPCSRYCEPEEDDDSTNRELPMSFGPGLLLQHVVTVDMHLYIYLSLYYNYLSECKLYTCIYLCMYIVPGVI